MDTLTFFLSSKKFNQQWDINSTPASGGHRILLEFYLEKQATVDKKYQEMLTYGYKGYLDPHMTSFDMYFAIIEDADGNRILLSGDPEPSVS
ncbi:MAG: hypothetical protein AAFU54_21305 [Chloroflexota bacterium]